MTYTLNRMDNHIDDLPEDTNAEDDVVIAPSDTLLGQLQRGHGAGFLWALREVSRTVHPLLIECIMHDPRCDSQVEDRSDYYARLALTLDMPLDSLSTYLKTSGDDHFGWRTPLTIRTLGRLAQLGKMEAVTI